MRIACIAVLLTGCGAACPPPSRVALEPGDIAVGVPGDADVIAASAEHRWAVLWQAREDTDGNGVVQVYYGEHGGRGGDRQDTWIVLGGGPGVRVDRFIDARGRWLAVIDDGVVQLIEATTGARTVLGPSLGEWAWRRDARVGGGSEITFAPDDRAVWLATRNRIVLVDLSTGERSEHSVDRGWIAWAYPEAAGTWIIADVLPRAPDDPGDPSQLPHQGTSGGPLPCGGLLCSHPAISRVAFRSGDPRPIELGRRTVLARAWGLIAASDDSLDVIRSADDAQIVATGCAPQLVHAGLVAPLVFYRCEGADEPMFSDGTPPRPTAALDASTLPEIDRELLELEGFLAATPRHLEIAGPAWWVGMGEYAWDASESTWRFYDWDHVDDCVWPESMPAGVQRRIASTHCIHGRTGSVHAIAEDGTALVSRFSEEDRYCPGGRRPHARTPQLVWTRLAIEPHAPAPPHDEPTSDPTTTP